MIAIPTGELQIEEWLGLRQSGISGSDEGAICGLNPYSSDEGLSG